MASIKHALCPVCEKPEVTGSHITRHLHAQYKGKGKEGAQLLRFRDQYAVCQVPECSARFEGDNYRTRSYQHLVEQHPNLFDLSNSPRVELITSLTSCGAPPNTILKVGFVLDDRDLLRGENDRLSRTVGEQKEQITRYQEQVGLLSQEVQKLTLEMYIYVNTQKAQREFINTHPDLKRVIGGDS